MMINQFLSRCKSAAATAQTVQNVVLGNEGGDMDSIIGGIFLAFLFTKIGGDEPVVPLLNFPLEDLALRNDVVRLLESERIDTSLLLSVVPSLSGGNCIAVPDHARITLFDHNRLAPHQRTWDKLVHRVVDHHADEAMYVHQCTTYEVAPVGSASTLVEELFFANGVPVPHPQLLLAPIVLDTMNFDPKHKKVTPRDLAARDRLTNSLPLLQDGAAMDSWFAVLNDWKGDTSRLTPAQLLRRDYKRFVFTDAASNNYSVGISSLPSLQGDVYSVYSKELWMEACCSFRAERKIDILAVMFAGSSSNGQFSRQLAVLSPPDMLRMFHHIAEVSEADVGLKLVDNVQLSDDVSHLFFEQRDSAVSRKKLTPLFADAIGTFFQQHDKVGTN